MKSVNLSELRFPNIITGLISGLIITLIFYAALYTISGISFTYRSFSSLHEMHPWLSVIDLIPLLSIGLAWYISEKRGLLEREYLAILDDERKTSDEAIAIARSLSKGRLNIPDYSDHDELLLSLHELKQTLIANNETVEKRKREDRQRGWISEGLAMFGGLLREHSHDLEDLSYQLISTLVNYMDANQGGFFLIEEGDGQKKYIRMYACYAYDRRKFADKRIEWGEGIIGTCVLEKKTVYMTDVPETYITITSGIGKATPK
ncbi:MAG TPA: GAF domain-containing protein, partial [Bacteroidales bacterium]|nr:GAF domain-containing protein [Bacteroidales bacterium]